MSDPPLAELPAWDRLTQDQPRGNITPRPPLIPVPASVLAAFAEG